MLKEQAIFFKELAYIQEYCVNVALSKKEKYCNTEEFLKGCNMRSYLQNYGIA